MRKYGVFFPQRFVFSLQDFTPVDSLDLNRRLRALSIRRVPLAIAFHALQGTKRRVVLDPLLTRRTNGIHENNIVDYDENNNDDDNANSIVDDNGNNNDDYNKNNNYKSITIRYNTYTIPNNGKSIKTSLPFSHCRKERKGREKNVIITSRDVISLRKDPELEFVTAIGQSTASRSGQVFVQSGREREKGLGWLLV